MSTEYGADQIQILEGLEAVRKRPGMYIGSTSIRGLHHLVYEIVDNAVDEALAGFCDVIDVKIQEDNSITVIDNGRGIPVGINHKAGIPAVEVVFTILHAGGKFGGGGYKVSGGLHGVGASVVNALSEWLEVTIYHEGKVYRQRYERGKTIYKLKVIGECEQEKTGTMVSFLPDKEIFEETVFDFDTLKQRFREMAFLTKGLKIRLTDERGEKELVKEFHYEGGIKEFVTYLNRSKEALYPEIIYCEGTKDGVAVEVAMQHNDSYNETTYGFVNNITTPEGGTHVVGFRNALTKTFNEYARKNKLLKENEKLAGEDIREGLTAIISVKIEEPQFEGQTKQKLGNSEARGAVDAVVSRTLEIFLEQNPSVAKTIVDKSVLAQRARIGELNELICPIHQKLSGGKEELIIQYEPNTEADQLEAAVKKSREADRKQKTTLVGPHRDDLSFYVNGIDIRRFGSQGQQRTAALSLKLAEIELVKKIKKEYPILLLDDVLSELDGKRQDHLLASIRHIQTIITCTGLDDFISHSFQIDKTFRVVSGTVTCERPNKTTSQT